VAAATIPVTDGSNALRVIVKLDAKRPTQVPAFDQAKDTIRQQLQALALDKAAAQFTTGLLKSAQIQQ
jgi:peptidyl-prolyl cis-trans isomerase C